jgi:hypothetical protein
MAKKLVIGIKAPMPKAVSPIHLDEASRFVLAISKRRACVPA